jgi:SRSO17 transposase
MDAGYGNDTRLRTQITALPMSYAAGIGANTSVWPPGAAPLLPETRSRRGRPQTQLQRDAEHQPVTVKALALTLPAEAWQMITWREGSADWLASRFARQRVRPAHRESLLTEPRPEEWLLMSGRQENPSRPSIGLPLCPRTSRLIAWLISPSYGGESSATIRSSSRNSAW